MELFTIVLASLLSIFSSVGVITDGIIQRTLQERLNKVEQLAVRLDNPPSHQLLLEGRIDRLRMAGRGVYPIPNLRVALLEVETDPIDIDLSTLNQGIPRFDQPLQTGIRLILEQKDLSQFLESPVVLALIREVARDALGGLSNQLDQYNITKPDVIFLQGDRIRFNLNLQSKRSPSETFILSAETGLSVVNGHQINLVEPQFELNGQRIPAFIVNGFLAGASDELNLKRLESSGVLARVLKLQITPSQLELALFLRVDPQSPLLTRRMGLKPRPSRTAFFAP